MLFLLLCSFGPPFSQEPRKEGAKILLDNVKFMVDLWHCEKHKEATCMPYLDNPKCIYHPKLSSFSAVHCVNTECAEQAFKWLGKFKFIARKMTRQRFCFFLWKMINEHNQRVCRKLQRPDQFDFSFHGPDRPKILGIQKKRKKGCGNAWPNCSRSWLQPALTSMFSSAIIRPRTIVKRSIAGRNLWRGDLQAQPEECGVKGQY